MAFSIVAIAAVFASRRLGMAAGLFIGLALAAMLGSWLTRHMAHPIRRLTRLARAYAQGEWTAQPPETSSQEAQELSLALAHMARAISEPLDRLRTQHHQATAVLESMAEGVIAVDPKGAVLLMNPAAGTLLDITTRGTGRSLLELVRFPELHAIVQAVLRERRRSTTEIRLLQPSERTLRIHALPCEAPPSIGPSAVLVIQDVTEHHRFEQLRKEFVANVSHELKSPLTAIRGLTETLLSGALNDPAHNRRFVQLIDEDAARLSRLIDDLLTLSQIESRAVPLNASTVALHPLVESLLRSFQPSIAHKRLHVANALPSDLAVRADADRVRQVCSNLIENAIKYNQDGGRITLSATRDGSWATITVADTGMGIPESDLPRLFERFYRADKARSRTLGGTGLGLSIVKHIIEAHGGQVTVSSRLHHGSAFSFTLPLAS